jgi:hypothetical protein
MPMIEAEGGLAFENIYYYISATGLAPEILPYLIAVLCTAVMLGICEHSRKRKQPRQ